RGRATAPVRRGVRSSGRARPAGDDARGRRDRGARRAPGRPQRAGRDPAAAPAARPRGAAEPSALGSGAVARSELTIDLGAIRRNAKTLLTALAGTELWAVVKADGYGHGAVDVADAVLGAGATALCVATVPEALVLRREFAGTRILVMGPAANHEIAQAREAR